MFYYAFICDYLLKKMISPYYTFYSFDSQLYFTRTIQIHSSNYFYININEYNNVKRLGFTLFTQNARDSLISELFCAEIETLDIRVNRIISNEIFELLKDIFVHLPTLCNLQITSYKCCKYFDDHNSFFTLFPKSIETLSLQTDLPNNILNVIAEHYVNLKFIDINKTFTVSTDVFFSNLHKLRLYEVHDPLSREELERLHGVEIVDTEMGFFTQRYLKIAEIMLDLIMNPLYTEYVIGIDTDHSDEITCFPNTTRIENELLDVDFIKAYNTYNSFTDEELMDNLRVFRILGKYNDEFKLFMSYIMYHLIYNKNMKVKVFDNSKEYGRINPLYNTIQMNTNVHKKIKDFICLLTCEPPGPPGPPGPSTE
jgi:hypothetical protein